MSNKVFNKLVNILSASFTEAEDQKSFVDNIKSKKAQILSLFNKDTDNKKDLKSPKKCRTSYIFFCCEQREKLKRDEPTLSTTQIVSKLASLWRNLKEEDKQKYKKMSEDDKKRYEKEMGSFVPDNKPVVDKPKRPLTSYLFFCNETRDLVKKEHPDFSGKQITTELGKRWKQLSDEEKQPYIEKQKLDKERYNNEKSEDFEEKKPKEEKIKPKKKEEPKEEKKSKKKDKEPKKEFIPTPGFEIFEEDSREELNDLHPEWTENMIYNEIIGKWNKLSKVEKQVYEVDAKANEEEELLDE